MNLKRELRVLLSGFDLSFWLCLVAILLVVLIFVIYYPLA